MLNPNDSYLSAFIILGLVCAIVGWGVIEFILWLFSFVHITIS